MIRFINFIDTGLGQFFQRIKASVAVDAKGLACFRMFFGLSMLTIFLPSWSWLSDVPPGFFRPRPLSVAYLTDGHLAAGLYQFFDILVIVLFVFLIIGLYTRATLITLFVLSSILYSFSYTFDKIDHYTTILMFTYFCMIFTNSGTHFALRKDNDLGENMQSRGLGLLAIIICFGMFTAGFPKLINWVDFDLSTSGFLHWFYPGYFNVGNNKLLTPYVFGAPAWLFEIADYTAAIFEVSGLYFLWKGKKHWVFYLLIATFFHLANLLVLNIDFTQNVLCYGVFILPTLFYAHYKEFAFPWKRFYKAGIGLVVLIALFKILKVLTDFDVAFLSSFYFMSGISILLSIVLMLVALLFMKSNTKKNQSEALDS